MKRRGSLQKKTLYCYTIFIPMKNTTFPYPAPLPYPHYKHSATFTLTPHFYFITILNEIVFLECSEKRVWVEFLEAMSPLPSLNPYIACSSFVIILSVFLTGQLFSLLSYDLFFQWLSAILFICTHDRWFQVAVRFLSPWSQDGLDHGAHYTAALARHLPALPHHSGWAPSTGSEWISPVPDRGLQRRRTWHWRTIEVPLQPWIECKFSEWIDSIIITNISSLSLPAIHFRVSKTVSIA